MDSCKILAPLEIRDQHLLALMHSLSIRTAPKSICRKFEHISSIHSYRTRNQSTGFYVGRQPMSKILKIARNLWNDLPHDLKIKKSSVQFKGAVKRFIRSRRQ